MGYETTLHGKLVAPKPVSEKFMKWFNIWEDMRHSTFSTDAIMSHDSSWQEKVPGTDLGVDGVLYATEEKNIDKRIIVNNNVPNKKLGDYYFPLTTAPVCEKETAEGTGEYPFILIPNGMDKPYEVKQVIKFFVECNDIVDNTGKMSGVICGIGEEFGDAWYILVNEGHVSHIQAYADNAKAYAVTFLNGNKEALKIFEGIYKSPMELEYYWNED